MVSRKEAHTPRGNGQRLQRAIGVKASRKLKARRESERTSWFWLGMFGLVGWSIAIPTVVGVALGMWIDRHVESTASWTLTLLLAGIAVGCLNAWYWIKQEGRRD